MEKNNNYELEFDDFVELVVLVKNGLAKEKQTCLELEIDGLTNTSHYNLSKEYCSKYLKLLDKLKHLGSEVIK